MKAKSKRPRKSKEQADRHVRLRIICVSPPNPQAHGATFGLQDNSTTKEWVICLAQLLTLRGNMKKKVLFICVHNSARSQMAEAFLNQICGEHFEAHSAGLEPGSLSSIVVEAMKEIGIDISHNQTKAVFDMYKSGKSFAYVITVCDETSAEKCPIYPGIAQRLHWSFVDPSGFQGSHEEKMAKTREVRDAIKAKVEEWFEEVCSASADRSVPS